MKKILKTRASIWGSVATGTYFLPCVALKYLQIVHCPLCPFQWQACWLRVCLPIGFFLRILINILPALPIKCGTFLLLLLFALFFVCLFVFNSGLSCLQGTNIIFASDLFPKLHVFSGLARTYFPHKSYYFGYAILFAMWGLQDACFFSYTLNPILGT